MADLPEEYGPMGPMEIAVAITKAYQEGFQNGYQAGQDALRRTIATAGDLSLPSGPDGPQKGS